jgi:hypothetical protein
MIGPPGDSAPAAAAGSRIAPGIASSALDAGTVLPGLLGSARRVAGMAL